MKNTTVPSIFYYIHIPITRITTLIFVIVLVALSGCKTKILTEKELNQLAPTANSADDLAQVYCLLPGQIIQLGTITYMSPGQAVKTTAQDCRIRGGEYVVHDRSNYETALTVWLSKAEEGDRLAQVYVGEIYEKGLGRKPDYTSAAEWYMKAAKQGSVRAQVNLGYLYEKGLGVETDQIEALKWYRKASGLKDTIERQQPRISGPSIVMTNPKFVATRDFRIVKVSSDVQTEHILEGKVIAHAGLQSFTVNNRKEKVDENGIFRIPIQVMHSNVTVKLIAIDNQQERATIEFELVPGEISTPEEMRPRLPQSFFGNYYALIIGNMDYSYLRNLNAPENDAKKIAKLLDTKYGFKTEVLINAKQYDILDALNKYKNKLKESDNFLIYYAGHGHLDKKINRGYWIPVDGKEKINTRWISNYTISDLVAAMSAKHILIVADSCYASTLTSPILAKLEEDITDGESNERINALSEKISRTVLASGDLEVLDDVFAKAFRNILKNNDGILGGQQLHKEITPLVVQSASIEQVPLYAPIKHAGHESGEFFFVPSTH